MRRSTTGLIAGLTLLLAVAVTTSGCRQGSFLGNRYNNFRAYYNTFYNARKAFEQGEEQLIRLDVQVDRSRFLPVFADVPAGAATPSTGATGGPFQSAIDKSADLLRERPDSKWADDALLLIGRSYFYQRNLVGAEAKFRETVAAAEAREQEALLDEARYWLGRTLGAQERYDEAGPVLEEALAREGLSRYWRARLHLALAEQYVQQRAWDEAAAALQAGLADLRDADLAGRASFLLGQVLEAKGDYDGAAAAYAAVEHHRPYYELLYAAQLSRALVLGIDAGRHDEALALIRRMRRDDKNFQKRAEVELAYARLLAAAGSHGEARERYEALLYDADAFAGTAVPRSEVHYYYGALYRDQLDDYVRAAAYLDTAATGLRTDPGREALVTHAALTGVRREADAFLEYAGIATRLAEADSLLALGALDDDALAARRAEIEAARRRAWDEEQRRLAALRARQGFQGGGVATAPGQDPYGRGTSPTPGLTDAGFLNYRDVARLQDALVAFQSIWGDRPLVPNWRRRQAIGGAVVDDQMNVVGSQGAIPQGRSPGGPPPLDWANVPRTPEHRAVLLTERASLRYELGNVLFLSLARPDSAAYWYGRVVEEDADALVAPRALYAMAEVRREQGRTAEAEAFYRRLLEVAPESALAVPAREQLGLPPLDPDDATEAAGRAAAAYDDAYAHWRRGAYPDALGGFLALAAAYGETEQAPRALLAAAEVFADWVVRQDTLAFEDGIPAALVPPALRDSLAAVADEAVPVPATPPATLPGGATPAPEEGSGEPIKLLQSQAEPDAEEPFVEEPEVPLLEEPDDEEPGAEAAGAALLPAEPSGMEHPEPVQAGAPGEVPVPADSTASVLADTTEAAPNPRLVDLLLLVEARYPGTRYAERARTRRLALLDPQEAPADTEAVASEGAPVVGLPAAPPDAGFPPEVVAGLPPETFGLEGMVPLNAQVGGYTWRLTGVTDPAEAVTLLRTYLGLGLRAVAVQETGENYAGFALLVGQFPSVAAAEATRSALPGVDTAAPPRVVALRGLRLLREPDLRRLVVTPEEGDID